MELCNICLIDGMSCQNAFAFYLDSTSLGIGSLLRNCVVKVFYVLANIRKTTWRFRNSSQNIESHFSVEKI